MRRLLVFMLIITTCALFNSANNAIAGSGYYPDSPVQISPSSNVGGTTVNFSFASYITDYYGYTAIPVNYYIEIYQGGTLVYSSWTGGSTSFSIPGFEDVGSSYTWRVYAYYEFYYNDGYEGYDYTSWSNYFSFTNGPSGPPAAPAQVIPYAGDNEGGETISFQWTPVAKADNYRLLVKTASGAVFFDQWLGNYEGVDLSGFPDLGGTYTWQVQAKNNSYTGTISGARSFVNGPSGPPATPSQIIPSAGDNEGGGTVSFQWTPVAKADNYRLLVKTLSGAVLFDQWIGNGDGMDLSGFPDLGETYTWQVQAKNNSYTGTISGAWSFVNGPSGPPATPSQIIPYAGDNEGGGTVSFQWTPVAKADNYRLLVKTSSGAVFFDQWLGNYEGVDLSGFPDLGETYTWQVQAKNNSYTGTISGTWSFINGPSGPPATPSQIIPYAGDNEGGGAVSFQWTPVAKADNYRLLVKTSSGAVFFDQWLGNYEGMDLSGFPDLGETYTWQVQAKNNSYTGIISGSRSFINGPSAPPPVPTPIIPFPGDNEGGGTISFQWSPVARADNYRLIVTSASGSVFFDQWIGNYDGVDLSGFADLGESYTWQVQAKNNSYNGGFSTPRSFINGPTGPPPAPTPIIPLAGDNEGGETVSFQWTPVARADNYRLIVTSVSGVAFFDQWLGNYDGVHLSGFADLGENFTWQVQAKNKSYTGNPSAPGSFVNGPSAPPPVPTPIIPLTGDNEGGGVVSFQWTPVSRADNYRLIVISSSGFAFFDQWLGNYDGVDLSGFGDVGETYTWQVQAKNKSYPGELSNPQTFVNGPSGPPATPSQIIPFDGANEGGETVSFQWTPVSRADNYRLIVTSASGSVFFDQWLGNYDGVNLPGFGDIGESYVWQVQAKNNSYSGNASSSRSFINGPSDVDLPGAPNLITPVNGSNVAGSTVNFSWGAVAGADSYVIEVAADPNFTHIVNQVVVDSSTSISIGDFSGVGIEYYWRAATVSGVNMGPYSPYSIFTNGILNKIAELPAICSGSMNSPACSATNVATGSLSHDQQLFSAKGTALSVSMQLFYNSLPSYIGPLGLNWSHIYDISLTANADGSVVLRDGSGRRSFYTKSGNSYISPPGDYSTLVKNGDNSYTITYRDGSRYNFRQDGKITSIVDRFNNTISFSYTGSDLTGITDPAQRTTTISYDQTTTPHRISTITDPNQKTYNFSYQGNTLWKVIHPAADLAVSPERGYWEYQYDPQVQGLLKSKRDPNGNVSQYTYYADHKMESAIDPEGVADPDKHTRSYVYPTNTDNLRTTTFTEKDGGPWLYTFDAQSGILKSKTDPNTKATTFTYYANGSLKSVTEPKDGTVRLTTFFTYDSYGNLLTQTDPVDLSIYTNPAIDPETVTDPATLESRTPPIKPAIRYSYDNANYDRVTSIRDERGTTPLVTTFAYTTENGGEVVTATITPTNIATITKHYPNGAVKEIVDANNTVVAGNGTVTEKSGAKRTSFSYYPDTTANRTAGVVGLLQTVTDPAGGTTTITSYDKNGNPLDIQVKDTAGTARLTSVQQFDALNRLKQLTKITATIPNIITKYGYDHMGNLSSLIDAETRQTRYEYNYNRQVKKITDAKVNDTMFRYSGSACSSCGSGVDMLTGVFDPNVTKNTPLDSQPHTAFVYDKLNRLEYEIDPLNKKMHYTYYDSGELKEKYDATAAQETLLVTYFYNNRGQITDKTFSDGTFEHYTYYPDGKLWTAANQSISYTYVWYDDGRLHTVTDTTNNRTISYDLYDGLGQRKQVTILPGAADQRVFSYDYDAANRPWKVISSAGTFTYSYDNLGRRDTLAYPNNTLADWDFDDLNRLTAITHKVTGWSPFATFSYQEYDKVGNRKTVAGNKAESYFYDEIYRLLTVTSAKSEGFQYDATGNRQVGPGPYDTSYVHNAANQMTSGRVLGYGYDNRGNQTTRTQAGVTDKSWTQTWDYNDRLIKVEKVNEGDRRTVTFKYDPFGRRIEKKVETVFNGTTTTTTYSYLYDNDDIIFETMTEGGITTKTFYTHGPGIDEHLAMERGGQFYYYHADGLGSITAITDAAHNVVQSYEYGSYGMVKSSATFVNSYNYAGREWDKEIGLYQYRARYYDPMEGRFIQKDPIGVSGGINLYSYVGGNPVRFVDPFGLFESHPLLRALVPGQIAWDDAVTAFENGNYANAAVNSLVMAGEQVLSVLPFGKASSLVKQGGQCASKGAEAAWDASRAGHIFRDAAGHVNPGTAASQDRFIRLFEQVASDPANLNMGIVKSQEALNAGVQGFTKVFRNGEQVWVQVRGGKIINAGVNILGGAR